MGDMGEVFRNWNDNKRRRRKDRMHDWDTQGHRDLRQFLALHAVDLYEHIPGIHYSFTWNYRKVDYWPSSTRWRYNNKAAFGQTKDLINFLNKRKVQPNDQQ